MAHSQRENGTSRQNLENYRQMEQSKPFQRHHEKTGTFGRQKDVRWIPDSFRSGTDRCSNIVPRIYMDDNKHDILRTFIGCG